ncbi:hypothetical protein MPSEU_001088100 [Mayamaea pseudoterrestris]|nr:hypothetical protein MPSEU_001088100 [Mayamaea pseudoterrestris]
MTKLFAHIRSHWKVLAIGQVLSFLFSCMSAAQASLSLDCGSSAPMFSLLWFYVALGCFLCCCRSNKHDDQHQAADESTTNLHQQNETRTEFDQTGCFKRCAAAPRPVVFFVMAALDVYGNFFIFLALSFTTLTSVTLLDALAVPAAMVLSRCFLRRSYTWVHFAGVILCLIGVVVNVTSDYEDVEKNTAAKSTMVKGDFLAIIGGILFGVNKVLGEVSVRNLGGPYEYLGNIGLYGALIAGVHCVIFERVSIGQTYFQDGAECRQGAVWGISIAFLLSGILSYVGAAQFLLFSEATFLNLSLLTGDAWSLAFSVIAERIIPDPLFYLALLFTLCGVLVYEMAPTPIVEDREAEETAAINAAGADAANGGDIELKVGQGEAV